MDTTTPAPATTPTTVDLFVTLPPGIPRGRTPRAGIVCTILPDGAARLSVHAGADDGSDRRETWDLPPETTFAEVMERIQQALTED